VQGPPGSANIDSGVVAVTGIGNGHATCAFAEENGPDKLTITVTYLSNVYDVPVPECVISGFPSDGVPNVTPLNSCCHDNVGNASYGVNPTVYYDPGSALDVTVGDPGYQGASATKNDFSFMIIDP
jgi:hypothetical protein